jgi:hypothetical protein
VEKINRYELKAEKTQFFELRDGGRTGAMNVGFLGRRPSLWVQERDDLPARTWVIELRGTGETIDDIPQYALFLGVIPMWYKRADEFVMSGVHVWAHIIGKP